MISVIIPAHNEEKVIANAIEPLMPGVVSNELEIIVVCNGCTDKTKEVVTSFGSIIKCFETQVPSKTNALNIGDTAACGFPRFYQDADVVLSLDAIRCIAKVLETGQSLAASPKMRMDMEYASWAVRSFYEVWQELPYVREGMIGTGVFALSEEGRTRFDTFPKIIADDGYVRSLFKTNERTVVDSCYSLIRAPSTLAGLIKIKTRSRLGGYELEKKFPELIKNQEKHYGNALLGLLFKYRLWSKLPAYLYVNVKSRYLAKKHYQSQGFTGWSRDDSSRENT